MTERILVTLTVDPDGIHRLSACLDGLPEVKVETDSGAIAALMLAQDVFHHLNYVSGDCHWAKLAAGYARDVQAYQTEIMEDGSFVRILVNGSPFDAAAAESAARAAASDDLIF